MPAEPKLRGVRMRLVLQRYDKVRQCWLPDYVPHTQDNDQLHDLISGFVAHNSGVEYFINEEEYHVEDRQYRGARA